MQNNWFQMKLVFQLTFDPCKVVANNVLFQHAIKSIYVHIRINAIVKNLILMFTTWCGCKWHDLEKYFCSRSIKPWPILWTCWLCSKEILLRVFEC